MGLFLRGLLKVNKCVIFSNFVDDRFLYSTRSIFEFTHFDILHPKAGGNTSILQAFLEELLCDAKGRGRRQEDKTCTLKMRTRSRSPLTLHGVYVIECSMTQLRS